MRLADWETRWHDFLLSAGATTFGYDHSIDPSHHDCCTLAAGNVEALTGDDRMAEFRGKYKTERGAMIALKKHGKGSVEATIDAKFEVIGKAQAMRGDLVMVDGTLGICIGSEAVFMGREGDREGLVRLPRPAWSKAWRVD